MAWVRLLYQVADAMIEARIGISKNRWHMPGTQTVPGIVDESMSLRLGALPHDETHREFAISRHCCGAPYIASSLFVLAPLLLFSRSSVAWRIPEPSG